MAPIRVVGDEFCVPYYTDLVVKKKLKSIFSSAHFQVFDPNGTLLFKVDHGGGFSIHSNRYMRDAGGFPIILMRKKIISSHDRWRVYRGDSHAENNLLFTVKSSNLFQQKTQLDVFLATNTDENKCDFHVKSNFSDHSSKVYRGDSVIAEIDKKSTGGGFFVGKDVFNVRVFPEVDYAFIVSLLIILQEITSSSNHSSSDGDDAASAADGGGDGGGDAVASAAHDDGDGGGDAAASAAHHHDASAAHHHHHASTAHHHHASAAHHHHHASAAHHHHAFAAHHHHHDASAGHHHHASGF